MVNVSIILVNYNTYKMTKECIDSIVHFTSDITYEIIVVDNASTDKSKELLSKDSRITYIYSEENLGFGKANNIGLEHSKGEFVLCLNTDTLLIEDSISKMYNIAKEKKIKILGVQLIDLNGRKMHSYGNFLPSILYELDIYCYLFSIFITSYFRIKLYFSDLIGVGYITGADLFIKKSVIDECGFFDPDFFMYFEEAELQNRFRQRGYTPLFFKGTSIIHLEGKSTTLKARREIMYFESRKICYNKMYSTKYCRIADCICKICLYLKYILSKVFRYKDKMIYNKQRYVIFNKIRRI